MQVHLFLSYVYFNVLKSLAYKLIKLAITLRFSEVVDVISIGVVEVVVVEVVVVVDVVAVISVVVEVISVVVEVISVVVVVISVVLDTTSSMQRLSPEMQSSLDSSMEGQFSKRTHTGTKV